MQPGFRSDILNRYVQAIKSPGAFDCADGIFPWLSHEKDAWVAAAEEISKNPDEYKTQIAKIFGVCQNRFKRRLLHFGAEPTEITLPLFRSKERVNLTVYRLVNRALFLQNCMRVSSEAEAVSNWDHGPGLAFLTINNALFGALTMAQVADEFGEDGDDVLPNGDQPRLSEDEFQSSLLVPLVEAAQLMRAPQIFSNDGDLDLLPTSAVSSTDEYALMIQSDWHPFLLFPQNSLVHGYVAESYLAAIHDFYHKVIGAGVEPEFRKIRPQIADAFRCGFDLGRLSSASLSFYWEVAERLADLDQPQAFDVQTQGFIGLFTPLKKSTDWVTNGLNPEGFAQGFEAQLRLQFAKHPRRDDVIRGFQSYWRKNF